MNKEGFFGKSECLHGWLHRYNITREWNDGVEELCEICKDIRYYKTIDGAIDNIEYLSYHERDILTPQSPYFYHEYPNAK